MSNDRSVVMYSLEALASAGQPLIKVIEAI